MLCSRALSWGNSAVWFLLHLTFNVRNNEHLRLRKALLEIVKMDGAVEGDEAYLCPGVSRKPREGKQIRKLEKKKARGNRKDPYS